LEGFNLTYKELIRQHEEETDKKHALDAEIATGDAELEKDRVDFLAQEKALQEQQHNFNELVQELRAKENEKNLASQRLHYLKEKDASLKEFLNRATGQLKNIEDSIQYTQLQYQKEEDALQQLKENWKLQERKRNGECCWMKTFFTDSSTHLQSQRKQFDAEKKVAVAETSV
jgi:chromosome segregation protein